MFTSRVISCHDGSSEEVEYLIKNKITKKVATCHKLDVNTFAKTERECVRIKKTAISLHYAPPDVNIDCDFEFKVVNTEIWRVVQNSVYIYFHYFFARRDHLI